MSCYTKQKTYQDLIPRVHKICDASLSDSIFDLHVSVSLLLKRTKMKKEKKSIYI